MILAPRPSPDAKFEFLRHLINGYSTVKLNHPLYSLPSYVVSGGSAVLRSIWSWSPAMEIIMGAKEGDIKFGEVYTLVVASVGLDVPAGCHSPSVTVLVLRCPSSSAFLL